MRSATLTAATLALTLGLSVPAAAHTEAEVTELTEELIDQFVEHIEAQQGALSMDLLIWFRYELERIRGLYTPPPTKTAPSSSSSAYEAPSSWVAGAEAWRPLVAAHFPANQVDYALAVIWCESKGVPTAKNPSSSASGLFQHLARYWPERSAAAGIPGADIFDPTASTIVAAWLVLDAPGGGWHHWTCRP